MRINIVRGVLILSFLFGGYLMTTNIYKFYKNSIYQIYDGSISYLIGVFIGVIIITIGIILSFIIKNKGDN